MINTLLEHVPIKMEVKDVDETEEQQPVNEQMENDLTKDEVQMKEVDEDLEEDDDEEMTDEDDEEDDEDDEEDEEESDIETDALEIEQEAIMLISSDEEAELEAQRIRFPDKIFPKKSSRSSSRNSQCSNNSSSLASKTETYTTKATNTREEDKKTKNFPAP